MWYLYTMEFYSARKKNEILSFPGKRIELENIMLTEVGLRLAKAACSPSYAYYKPTTNAAILCDMGHTKGRLHMGGIGQGKEAKNLNVVMCSLCRNEYRNLRATMGRGLGRSEED
jgi:hypothetical protein